MYKYLLNNLLGLGQTVSSFISYPLLHDSIFCSKGSLLCFHRYPKTLCTFVANHNQGVMSKSIQKQQHLLIQISTRKLVIINTQKKLGTILIKKLMCLIVCALCFFLLLHDKVPIIGNSIYYRKYKKRYIYVCVQKCNLLYICIYIY